MNDQRISSSAVGGWWPGCCASESSLDHDRERFRDRASRRSVVPRWDIEAPADRPAPAPSQNPIPLNQGDSDWRVLPYSTCSM